MAENAELVKLATVVSEAKDENIPSHLLQLKRLLEQFPKLSKERQSLKHQIIKFDLLSYCSVVLKYDFLKVEGGFATAVGIIDILFECCVGVNLVDSEDFSDTTLPEAVQSSLFVAWQIQQKFLEKLKQYGALKYGVHAEEMAMQKVHYNSIMDALSRVLTSHTYLVNAMLKSDNLIRIIIAEDVEVVKLIISTLEIVLRGIRVNPHAVKQLPTTALNHLLDELVFKITTAESEDLAAVTVKIIVAMVNAHSELANKMSVRFKGLKALMTRWLGHGFDRTLQNLIAILDAGNAKIAELARRTQAVKTIWAAYQGWKARARVGNLKKVIPSLQSSFRRKRQQKLERALKEKLGHEQKFQSEVARRKMVRSSRENQLQMLEIVPARSVNRHIQREESSAAVKIQSIWRGAVQRRQYKNDQFLWQATKAVIIIQRAVRRFLSKRKKMRKPELKLLTVYSKLTEERRKELQMRIEQQKVIRCTKERTPSETQKIHDETQRRLLMYHTKRMERSQFHDLRLQALLAKLHTEEEYLENLPNLGNAVSDEIDNLAFTTSTAVSVAAEREHKKMMKEFTSQWWQKLSLKDGENLDPFDDRVKCFDANERELEELLNM